MCKVLARLALVATFGCVVLAPRAVDAQNDPSRPVAAQNDPSPGVATLLSGGSSLAGIGLLVVAGQFDVPEALVPVGLGVGGLLVGPSTGFFYAGATGRGMASAGLRLGALAAAWLGFGLAWSDEPLGPMIFFPAAAVFTGSMIHDVATVGDAARAASRVELGVDPRGRSVRLGIRMRS